MILKAMQATFASTKNLTSTIKYIGSLRCEAIHHQSGTLIQSDAPTDNQGKGQKFSPTDMCAVSLGQCALTTIAILGAKQQPPVKIDNAKCDLQKIMASDPRRIKEIVCQFHFPGDYDQQGKKFIEQTAHNCPVAKSLHPDLVQTMKFTYGQKGQK